ncbi:MAG: nucleotide pyrophosphatase/phosphodiesterase family protein [Nannocystaceae bacterium]
MKHPTLVLNVVGLTRRLIGEHSPALAALAQGGASRALRTVTPAVTCAVQASFLTGLPVREHGVVGNGWYFRDTSEVRFWCQSNRLITGEQIWETAKRHDPSFRGTNLFWWFNMYGGATTSVTPRPVYPADGRKIPDLYTEPAQLRNTLQSELGRFPLFKFWGPTASLESSQWIARCAIRMLDARPDLALVYLPHLDYDGQRFGPRSMEMEEALRRVDALCGEIMATAQANGYRVIVLSEYGITEVTGAVAINRVLRHAGLVRVREELGRELLDPGASQAFAVADHQIAHVYVRQPGEIPEVQKLLTRVPGVERILDRDGQRALALDHPRSGELVAIACPDRWFSYNYWLDDERAPDFARCVDIHRKPGYDPVELFLDPAIRFPRLRIGATLLARKLGQRTLMDMIPLDTSLVKGSHGRPTDDPQDAPVYISSEAHVKLPEIVHATDVKDLILRHVFDDYPPRTPGRSVRHAYSGGSTGSTLS